MYTRGFTLIELMIVTAIVGILVAVAFPAYQDYSIRTRVAEGLTMAGSAKLAVSETVLTNRVLPATQAETGYASPIATTNVASITIAAGGVITITYTVTAGGGTILMTPTLQANGDLDWDCTGGTTLAKHRPASCRP